LELLKSKRPKVLDSVTEKVKTGCGHLYVTVGFDGKEDTPVEVRAALGKAGGCSNCFLEALNRSISLGLEYGIPVDEFVKELMGHKCPSPNMWPEEEKILSCPDGISQVLSGYCKTRRS